MNLDEFNISDKTLFTLTFMNEFTTFALFKLPTLCWGTYLFKIKSYLLEVLMRF